MNRNRLPPLDWLRTFEAAARLNSFTAAADELAMTQASVSYHIRSLEKWLGAGLFERLPRSVQLTEIGRGYLPAIRRSLQDLTIATEDLFGAGSQRSIIIQAPIAFASLWLAPRLNGFSADHPETEIRLQTINWPAADAEDSVDIDIRYGKGDWPGMSSQLLLDEPAILVCAPSLADRLRGNLAAAPLIHIIGTGDLWESVNEQLGDKLTLRKELKVDSSIVALEMASGGLGVALVLACFAEPYLRTGRLVQPLPLQVATQQAHYIVAPIERRQPSIEVGACLAWLLGHSS